MQFPAPLIPAALIRRYKRFLADVVLETGETMTAHVANPGSMIGLNVPRARIWLSRSADPKRKLAYSWELIEIDFEPTLRLLAGLEGALDGGPPLKGDGAGAGEEERLWDHGGRVGSRPRCVKGRRCGCQSQVGGTGTTFYSFPINVSGSSRNQRRRPCGCPWGQ